MEIKTMNTSRTTTSNMKKYSTIFVKSYSSRSSAKTFFQSIFGNKSNSTSNQQVDQPHRADSWQSTLPKGNNINIKTYGVTSKKSASPEEKNVPFKTYQADNSKQLMLHTINIQETGLDVKTHQSDFKDQILPKETDQTLKTDKYYQLQKKNAVLKHELIVAGCIDEALDIEERIHTDLRNKLIDKAEKSEEDVTGYLQSGLWGIAETVIYDRNDSFESREKLVKENYSQLPEDVQLEYLDAMIFYHEEDRELANEFLRDTGINTCGTQYKVALYDDINHETRSKLQHLHKTCKCSMLIFVFITKTVTSQRNRIQNNKELVPEEQEWNTFFEEVCTFCNGNQKNNIVPVRACTNLEMPFGVKSKMSLDFFKRDSSYLNNLELLLSIFNKKKT